jgi:hypothetical protein
MLRFVGVHRLSITRGIFPRVRLGLILKREMRASIQEALISVWRQTLVENLTSVTLGDRTYRVKKTSKTALRQVDFFCEGEEIRGLEQNPTSQSRWGAMAREGKLVMQFLFGGAYIANVADGVFTEYSGTDLGSKQNAAAGR